jgi:hypothetical protein
LLLYAGVDLDYSAARQRGLLRDVLASRRTSHRGVIIVRYESVGGSCPAVVAAVVSMPAATTGAAAQDAGAD